MIQPDRNILTAALLLHAIATDVEKARRHLTNEIRYHDGTPTTASGADNNGSRGERTIRVRINNPDGEPILDEHGNPQYDNVPATIVEAAAINRQHIEDMRDDLNACVKGVVTMANNIAQTTQRILGTRVDVPRCDGGVGRTGHLIARAEGGWSDPSCRNVPAEGRKTCDACRQRFHRWARDNEIRINHVA